MSKRVDMGGEWKHVQNSKCSGQCRMEILEGQCCAHNEPNGCEYYTNWLAFQKQEEVAGPKSPWTDWRIDEVRFTGKKKQPESY